MNNPDYTIEIIFFGEPTIDEILLRINDSLVQDILPTGFILPNSWANHSEIVYRELIAIQYLNLNDTSKYVEAICTFKSKIIKPI